MQGITFQVAANVDWQYKFSVNAHDGFMLTPNGRWFWDPNQPSVGAGGTGQNNPDMPVSNAPQGCLLVQIREKHPVPVIINVPGGPGEVVSSPRVNISFMLADSGMQGFEPNLVPYDADILFRINDDNIDDNEGQLTIQGSY